MTLPDNTAQDAATYKANIDSTAADHETRVGLTLESPIATTSGTAIALNEATPSWVKRINVMFNAVSADATALPVLRIGDSGGYEATNYVGGVNVNTSTTNVSSGFGLYVSSAASTELNGFGSLVLMDASTNTWCWSALITNASGGAVSCASVKSLSAALDRIQLTTNAGTAVFDNGSVSISYE